MSVPDLAQLMTPEAFAEKMAEIRRKHFALIADAVAKDERYDQLFEEMKRHDPHARKRDARESALVKAQNVMRLSAYRLTCEFVGLVVDWHLSGLVPPEDA